jgi:hypothetical protein
MPRKYVVIRAGLSQRDGDSWTSPKVGEVIELSDAAAVHLLSEQPPFVKKEERSLPRPEKLTLPEEAVRRMRRIPAEPFVPMKLEAKPAEPAKPAEEGKKEETE